MPIADITLNDERLSSYTLSSGTKEDSFLPLLLNIAIFHSSRDNKTIKVKVIDIEKEEIRLLLADDFTVCV